MKTLLRNQRVRRLPAVIALCASLALPLPALAWDGFDADSADLVEIIPDALPNSQVMIHQPLGGFQGQATDIDIHAREILRMRETLNGLLAKHTGQPIEKIAQDTERDNFMTAEMAQAYGLVDKVLASRRDLLAEKSE